MNSSDGDLEHSRRSFLFSSGGVFTSLWVATHWPAIAAAAHHAETATADDLPPHFDFFNAADAADVDSVCAQIVPSGATPGAREAHAVYFIDRSLGTYMSEMAPAYRKGLAEFQAKFRLANVADSFAKADDQGQISFLKTVDRSEFFELTRTLTVLGMFSSPKYGGNFHGAGWKLMGFVDQHAFTPPFGYYDALYTGFVPYAAEKTS
jgi:gluconate 2-dehydrogenase gamma chain